MSADGDVQRRDLWGGYQDRIELTVTSDRGDAYAALLAEAADLVAASKPGAVTLSGIFWDEANDVYRLDVFLEDPAAASGTEGDTQP